MLSHAPAGTYTYDDNVPAGCRTPDSIMSLGGYSVTASGFSNSNYPQWRLPEKLQIVKPMEGSQTLRNWKSLATPTLSGLLEERPGVTIRGGRGLDELGLQVNIFYSNLIENIFSMLFFKCRYTLYLTVKKILMIIQGNVFNHRVVFIHTLIVQ